MSKARASCNQWGELDETPIIGQWHVRHSIPAARDTGYLFGKNFVALRDALDFCAKQEGHCRLLTHVEGDGWLWIGQPFQSYFVPGAKPPLADQAQTPFPRDLRGADRLGWIAGHYGPQLPPGVAQELIGLAYEWSEVRQ